MSVSLLAGPPADPSILINVPKLVAVYSPHISIPTSTRYVGDLPSVVDVQAIRDSHVHIGVDPPAPNPGSREERP